MRAKMDRTERAKQFISAHIGKMQRLIDSSTLSP